MDILTPELGIKILGHGRVLPGPPVSNIELLARHPRTAHLPAPALEALAARLEARFGMGRRHLVRRPGGAPGDPTGAGEEPADETSESLSLAACRQAVSQSPDTAVAAFVHGTTTSSRYTGSQAPVILAALGSHAPGYEIKAGCSTSLASLYLGVALLAMGHDNVLVSCAETLSKVMNPRLRETWFVLADGGAALWMARDREAPDFTVERVLYHTDGNYADLYTTRGKLPPNQQDLEAGGYALFGDGAALREQALERYLTMVEAMFPGGRGLERIRWLIPHQVNRALIDDVCARTRLDAERVWSADRVGNLGGASILFSLAEAVADGRLRSGDDILMMSVGGGLTFAMQHWRAL